MDGRVDESAPVAATRRRARTASRFNKPFLVSILARRSRVSVTLSSTTVLEDPVSLRARPARPRAATAVQISDLHDHSLSTSSLRHVHLGSVLALRHSSRLSTVLTFMRSCAPVGSSGVRVTHHTTHGTVTVDVVSALSSCALWSTLYGFERPICPTVR